MTICRNIIANYASQLYGVGISILFVPLYVRYMGIEAYGLVGVYAMLQGWFVVLDMGLTPTVTRETARFNGGAISALELRRLFRALEGIFAMAALAGASAMIASSGTIATRWLNLERQSTADVQLTLYLIAVVVALRWVCGLYRSAITGFEDLLWLSGFTSLVATARFALIVPFLIFVGTTPIHFFAYQLVVTAFEITILVLHTYKLMPPVDVRGFIGWHWQPVRPVLKFALSAALASAIWVVVTNTDKLLLSGWVSLADYGYFTLAVLVASGITLLSSPIGAAVLPRLTGLNAQGDEAALVSLYRGSTQLVMVIITPIVLMLTLFPEQVLMAWTNQDEVARNAAPILALYALGNWLLALIGFPYYLQVARGNLTLHVGYSTIFIVLFVPSLLWAVSRFGVAGAGYAWIGANLLPFLLWLPIVHHRFLAGVHVKWLVRDIAAITILPIVAALAVRHFAAWSPARIWLLVELALVYMALAGLAGCTSSVISGRLKQVYAASRFSRRRDVLAVREEASCPVEPFSR